MIKPSLTPIAHRYLWPIFKAVLEVLFPTKCLVCGSFFNPSGTENGNGSIDDTLVIDFNRQNKFNNPLVSCLCPACLQDIETLDSPMCSCCGIMLKGREGQVHLCGECISAPKNFRIARAPFVYDQTLMNVVHRFKYQGKIQLAKPLGGFLLAAFLLFWEKDPIDIIIPVPLHSKKFRERGFNQAFLLIHSWKYIASVLNVDLPDIEVNRDILARNRPTASQTGLGRKERLVNIKDAFKVRHLEMVQGKRILLVDDVYTTGATVNECARVLLKCGAEQVDVLTLARAM